MNLSSFKDQITDRDDSGKTIVKFDSEALRLSNELRFVAGHNEIKDNPITDIPERVWIPDKWGFDCETAPIEDFKRWLNDTTIKKSQSLLMFVYRIISVRFPTEFHNEKEQIDKKFRKELDLIESESRNDIVWFGEVGFQNMVRLDGSLTNPKRKVVKRKNDIEITRI